MASITGLKGQSHQKPYIPYEICRVLQGHLVWPRFSLNQPSGVIGPRWVDTRRCLNGRINENNYKLNSKFWHSSVPLLLQSHDICSLKCSDFWITIDRPTLSYYQTSLDIGLLVPWKFRNSQETWLETQLLHEVLCQSLPRKTFKIYQIWHKNNLLCILKTETQHKISIASCTILLQKSFCISDTVDVRKL